MIKGPLDADGRIAAKNATKIRGALLEMADYKKIFEQYQETHPVSTSNKAQDNARARSWAIMNVRLRMEAMESALWRTWAEAFVLGQAAAGEWIRRTAVAQKAADDGYIDWKNWKPGDLATALMLRRPTYFQRLLQTTGATIKGMERASLTDIGNALATSIELGMGAEEAAVMIGKHVASSSRALTIAITEQNRAMSAGSIQRYKEAELEKMEWHVSDPCDKCAQNAGVVVPIGTSFPSGATQPPQHPHCRCVLLPVIPGMEEDSPVTGAVIAPMPTGAAHVGEMPAPVKPVEAPKPAKSVAFKKNAAKNKNLQAWDQNKIYEISKIKDKTAVETKIWNGASNEYIKVWRQPGDDRLKAILDAQGFSKTPTVVNQADFEALAKKGGIKVFRGVTDTDTLKASDMISQFKNGDMFVGTGILGNGVYSGVNYDYVLKYAGDKTENVMEMVLSSKAKYIESKAAEDGARALSSAFYDAAFSRKYNNPEMGKIVDKYIEAKGGIPQDTVEAIKFRDELREVGWLYHEPGAYAAINGYDAIRYSDIEDNGKDAVYVILNRGAVVVKE